MKIIKGLPPETDKDTDVAIDTEIYGMTKGRLHLAEGDFASMQICIDDTVYVITNIKDLQTAWDRIKNARHIIGQNIMFDIRQLMRWIKIERRPVWCVMNMDKNLWGGYYDIHDFSLADLCRRYLDIHLEKDVRTDFGSASFMTDEMLEYSAKDAYYTLQVQQAQVKEIEERGDDMRTYWEIDEPSIWTFLKFQPIKVDTKRWLSMTAEFAERGMKMQDELGVNVYSNPQMKEAIKKEYGKEVDSTAKGIMEELGGEFAEKVLLIRQLRKASSTYGEKWIEKYADEDGLVRSDFYINGTETGRPSSSNPNLLNIPARKIPEYRELFIPKYDKMIVADISAQEPRILCSLCGDENLLDIFKRGGDIHLMVTRAIFHDDTIKKSDPRRDIGKMINLASSYGMTASGLSKKLNIDIGEADKFLMSYFSRFPKVYEYKQTQQEKAHRLGYVETITGRRIWMNRHNYQWMNNAINAPIQGSAADFTKMWLNLLLTKCEKSGKIYPVVVTVYDEIVADVKKEDLELYEGLITDAFNETATTLFPTVPFEMDMKHGNHWGCKQLEKEE